MRKALFVPILASALVVGCPSSEVRDAHSDQAEHSEDSEPEVIPADLKPKITDVKVGSGTVAEVGDLCVMTYTGKLSDGKVFDSTAGPDKAPYNFVLGDGKVIPGWDRGIPGMKVGGKRTLVIPAILGYGKKGTGPIPPNADLTFDVDLLYVVKKGQEDVYDSTDVKVGTGREAKDGDTVSVNYNGTLLNGLKFDSSYDRKVPFEFVLGTGAVIKGWDAGIKGMKVGGKRTLVIPPAIAYQDRAQGKITPNSVLHFDVELLNIK